MLPSRSLSFSAFQRFSISAALLLLLAGALLAVEPLPSDLAPPERPTLSSSEVQALQEQEPVADRSAVAPEGSTGRPEADTPRRIKYVFTVTARGVYDDNINLSSTSDKIEDFYFAIEPSIFLGLGDQSEGLNFLSLTYRPSLFMFLDSAEVKAQHLIRLQGSRHFGHLALSLSQDIQILDGQNLNTLSDPTGHQANIDVNARVKHQLYTTALGASYDLTGKLFLTIGGAFSADQYETNISSQNLAGNLYLNYRYSDKLTIGIGGTGGYNNVDEPSPDQTFEQANLRLSYAATAKVGLSASGGVEFRQSDGKTDNTTPVFSLSAHYAPFDGTSISLEGTGRTKNSAVLAGQDYTETRLNLSVNQRLVRRIFVGLAVGYTRTDYFSTVAGFSATRKDNYYYIQPSVDTNITRYWTVGAYYMYREDSSNIAFFDFVNHQVGLRTKLTF